MSQRTETPKILVTDGMIPQPDPTFVPFGAYEDIRSIIESRIFFPVFISGPTRCGKTLIPRQACAELKRHLYRVNITIETDESDLLGGYTMVNGDTIWEDGPAIKAAEDPAGGILLLDEVSLGSNKTLCLQPLLEGNSLYLKKRNRWVHPTEGFNVVGTDNTKGRGSEDGKYIGTNVMNEAMLERFAATYEQTYPEKKIEMKILKNNLEQLGADVPDFVESLCQWAENIRKTHAEGGFDEVITTGRLIHIIKAYMIFGRNRVKAIRQAIARFDLNTQGAFMDAYKLIDINAKDAPDGELLPSGSKPAASKPKKPW